MSRTLFTSRAGGDLKLPANRQTLGQAISLTTLHFMRQTHSDLVMVVDEKGENFECDALVTSTPGVGIAALAADCMPITFSAESVVGVAHIGRVGLGSAIAIKTVRAMRELGAQEIVATIGPSICRDCYEVSSDMYREFILHTPASSTSQAQHSLDLQRGVRAQLEANSVTVINLNLCTLENPLYFSFRRGGESARQAGIISL